MPGVAAQLRALVVALAACAVFAGSAHAAFPGPNGAIAFTRVTTVCGDPNPCMLVEVRKTGGPVMSTGSHPAWSADGQRLAFVDGDGIYTVKPDGSDRQQLFEWAAGIEGIAWAPGGDRLAAALGVCDGDECRTDIHVIDLGPAGAEGVVNITPDLFPDKNPAWSPDGDRIAFDTTRDSNQEVFTMDIDGGNLARLTTHPGGDSDPNWAPSGDALAFTSTRDGEDAIYRMEADGSAQTRLTGLGAGGSRQPAWSPDGTLIVFSGIRGEIRLPQRVVISADGGSEWPSGASQGQSDFEPDWQPASIAYARPRFASPLKVSFVPSFVACTAPNRIHGPPLAFDSCNPPSQNSPHVTVGTPDANGAAADSVGFASFRVWPPSTWFETDFNIELSLSDIRCGSGATTCGPANDRGGPDYTGEVQLEHLVRLTEKTQPSDPTTVQDFRFRVDTTCSATSSTATGAVCSVHTSANAVAPGSVIDGRRTIWQMGPIRVLDGGADGDAGTAADNRLFAKQGVFVP